MLRSLLLRILVRTVLSILIISSFVVAYIHIHDDSSDTDAQSVSGSASTTRTAQYIFDDPAVHFQQVAKFDISEISDTVKLIFRTDQFGGVYLSLEKAPAEAANQRMIVTDSAGGLHAVFCQGGNVMLTSSADGGATWNEPVPVIEKLRLGGKSATSPVVVAGDSGRVAIVWRQDSVLMGAYTTDAFSADPSFHETVVSEDAGGILPSAVVDSTGALWLAYASYRDVTVIKQIAPMILNTGALWSGVGRLKGHGVSGRFSLSVRQDLTGDFSFIDPTPGLLLHASRFKVQTRDDETLAISGSGMLRNGTRVAFTVVVPPATRGSRQVSISLSNGYFASGTLLTTPSLEADLHIVEPGGKTLEIPH